MAEYIEREITCFDDCFHNPICLLRIKGDEWKKCVHFKNKADVVEVRPGMWKVSPDEYEICASEFECSECKASFCTSELTDKEFLDMMKYCPNCGAKMVC